MGRETSGGDHKFARQVQRTIARQSFCVLATASRDVPHSVGVLYAHADGCLWVSTQQTSKKARNIQGNPRVAVTIPVRRYPLAPPFVVQFGGVAELLDRSDPAVVDLLGAGRLKKITSHGELDDASTTFIRISPNRRAHTYGIGVPLRVLLRDPIGGSRTVDLGGGPA